MYKYCQTIALILSVVLLLAGCGKEQTVLSETVEETVISYQDDALQLLENYLEACTDPSAQRSAKYLLVDQRDYTPLLSCKVRRQTELNDQLWVFTVQQETAQQLFSGPIFVGLVEEKLYVFPTVLDVPVELRIGFPWENYIITTAAPPETEAAEETTVPAETTLPPETKPAPTFPATPTTPAPTESAPATTPTGAPEPPPGDHALKVTGSFDCINGGTLVYQCQYCDWGFTVEKPATGSHTMLEKNYFEHFLGCEQQNYYTWTCENCDYVETGNLPLQGHQWEAVHTEPPTTNHEGYTSYVCSICGGHKSDDFIPAIPTEPPVKEEENG